ncbi:MAG: aminotransferase class V-fold PLP-dependent enzyme [Gammaproteobacteria bacterium]|nr:aminotransferase class V-fold PLP-dependent enzyme [Gammaproteobacteria bacterium]
MAFVDWLSRYLAQVEQYPVRAQVEPGAFRAQLPAVAPLQAESAEQIIADLDRLVVPALTHWQSPKFFGYFPANHSVPSIMAELVSATFGVQGMLWITSPACTELETHMLDWLVDLCQLPTSFKSTGSGGGVLQDSASSGLLCALLAARDRATNGSSNLTGCRGDLTVYGSTQTHSSLEKAVMVAGLGRAQLRKIPVDNNFAMDPTALARQIDLDRAAGFAPTFVCATVGTTSTMAFDPVPRIGQICRAENIWLHVDAALAGSAAVCPEYQGLLHGLEFADSYSFNPHKWLLTNFDCSCLYVSDREALISALSITPEYLRNTATEAGTVVDYRDWQIPLGRRFRALKLWFVIRRYGLVGLQAHIRGQIALTCEFADWVRADPRFEIMAPVALNLVCFRYRADNKFNQTLLETLNASGELFLSHTVLEGCYVLRMCVGQPRTEHRHIVQAWQAIVTLASKLAASGT